MKLKVVTINGKKYIYESENETEEQVIERITKKNENTDSNS